MKMKSGLMVMIMISSFAQAATFAERLKAAQVEAVEDDKELVQINQIISTTAIALGNHLQEHGRATLDNVKSIKKVGQSVRNLASATADGLKKITDQANDL